VVPTEGARTGEAILRLHGGWFNWGSAQAYRNLVGHIAARTGVEAFICNGLEFAKNWCSNWNSTLV
jgi:acetyl esterase/lipase